MFSRAQAIACGDVVVCRDRNYVVYKVQGDGILMVEVVSECIGGHRSDVIIDSWEELATSGLALRELAIRCAPFLRAPLTAVVKVGTISTDLMARVERHVQYERLMRRFEMSPAMESNLLAAAHSCGRRTQTVRHA